jgi:hypothetical protein
MRVVDATATSPATVCLHEPGTPLSTPLPESVWCTDDGTASITASDHASGIRGAAAAQPAQYQQRIVHSADALVHIEHRLLFSSTKEAREWAFAALVSRPDAPWAVDHVVVLPASPHA